jgi:hypothetical protein
MNPYFTEQKQPHSASPQDVENSSGFVDLRYTSFMKPREGMMRYRNTPVRGYLREIQASNKNQN